MADTNTALWRRYLRFWGPDAAADVEEEFAFHLEMRVAQLVDEGYTDSEARAEALRGFGNLQQTRKVCTMLAEERERSRQRARWWSDWRFDARAAIRQLTSRPVTTTLIVATIALGVGATVSIFSVLNAVVLRPLPFEAPDRIVFVYETWRQFQNGNASGGHVHDWTEQGDVFEHVAAQRRVTFNLADGGEPERVIGATVTPSYF